MKQVKMIICIALFTIAFLLFIADTDYGWKTIFFMKMSGILAFALGAELFRHWGFYKDERIKRFLDEE